jgi:hypothetical protein
MPAMKAVTKARPPTAPPMIAPIGGGLGRFVGVVDVSVDVDADDVALTRDPVCDNVDGKDVGCKEVSEESEDEDVERIVFDCREGGDEGAISAVLGCDDEVEVMIFVVEGVSFGVDKGVETTDVVTSMLDGDFELAEEDTILLELVGV